MSSDAFIRPLHKWYQVDVPHITTLVGNDTNPPMLVIGVKSSVLYGASARQAIRETWASHKTLQARGVYLVFIGCKPVWTHTTQDERMAFERAIAEEKHAFHDLLTNELDCIDSYYALVDKVVAFLDWVVHSFPSSPQFVMISDDDIYLRVDQLIAELSHVPSPTRYYAGQVWATQYKRSIYPQRDRRHQNFLSHQVFPMKELPPFANGPHYLLSMDCVAYIARNRADLRGFGALDDLSVAFWLLGLQIHPIHMPQFVNLRDSLCRNDAISLADLTSDAIRFIDHNLASNQSLCHEFAHETWMKKSHPHRHNTENASYALQLPFTFEWRVRYAGERLELQIETIIRPSDNEDESPLQVMYTPSVSSYFAFCDHVATRIQDKLLVSVPSSFCLGYRQLLRGFVSRALTTKVPTMRPLFSLLLHNLYSPAPAPIVTIVYSPQARFAKQIIENLLTTIYKSHVELLVLDLATYHRGYGVGVKPDVFIFSILDGGCRTSWDEVCQRTSSQYIAEYKGHSRLLMIAGEAWSTDGLDDQVILLTTVENTVNRGRHVYLPVASSSFGERMNHSPTALLRPTEHSIVRKFCAYMYAQCDRPHREYMFDLLNASEPVDALGMCQGSLHPPDMNRLVGRLDPFYNDEAVEVFRRYKFVIAFENAQTPGYVTEKLVNAFLAGSIPIYFGHSSTVSRLFNSKSFIDCGTFGTLRECAAFVLRIHRSDRLYQAMRKEPPVVNTTAFHDIFSWHPDVPSTRQADELRRLLNNT